MKKYRKTLEILPEIIQLWETAWSRQPTNEAPFLLEMANPREAKTMRQRLYSARQRMLEDSYPGAIDIAKLEISLVESTLVIKLPSWLQTIRTTLEKEAHTLPPLPVHAQEQVPEPALAGEPDNLSSTLQQIYGVSPEEEI